jgi:hypothetical protein
MCIVTLAWTKLRSSQFIFRYCFIGLWTINQIPDFLFVSSMLRRMLDLSHLRDPAVSINLYVPVLVQELLDLLLLDFWT